MPEPRRLGRDLSAHQKNALAKGLAAGLSSAQIASGINCAPSVVEDLVRHDADIAKRRDAFAGRSLSKITESQFAMADYLPKADKIIGEGLEPAQADEDGNIISGQPFATRLQTAMYVRSQAIPKATQRHEHDHEHRHAHEVSPEVEGAIVGIAKTLTSLRQRHDPDAILQRAVREGPEALPTPAAGIELLPAEAESEAVPAPQDEDDGAGT